MTKQATARNAADAASKAADDPWKATTDVANDATKHTADARNEAAERTVVGLRKASGRAVSQIADTQKWLSNNIENFSQRLQGLSSFSQQSLEAFARSSEITAKALESIRGQVAAYTRKSYEDRVAAAQEISTARTLAELVEKQTSFAPACGQGLGAAGDQDQRDLHLGGEGYCGPARGAHLLGYPEMKSMPR